MFEFETSREVIHFAKDASYRDIETAILNSFVKNCGVGADE